MNDYNAGDLVEARKGEELIRGRAGERGVIGYSGRTVIGLEDEGFTITVIEKAAPPLPTEPGIYADKDGSPWHLEPGEAWEELTPKYAPYTRLEPVDVTVEKVAAWLDLHGAPTSACRVRAKFGVTE